MSKQDLILSILCIIGFIMGSAMTMSYLKTPQTILPAKLISLEQEIYSIEFKEGKCSVNSFDIAMFRTPKYIGSNFDLKSCEGLSVGDKITIEVKVN